MITIEYLCGLDEKLPAAAKAAIAAAADLVLAGVDPASAAPTWLGHRIEDAYNQMHGPTFEIKVYLAPAGFLVRVFPLMAG